MTVTVEYEAEEKLDLPYEEIIKNVIEESLDYVECPYECPPDGQRRDPPDQS